LYQSLLYATRREERRRALVTTRNPTLSNMSNSSYNDPKRRKSVVLENKGKRFVEV
jgi:hypothetical protein